MGCTNRCGEGGRAGMVGRGMDDFLCDPRVLDGETLGGLCH